MELANYINYAMKSLLKNPILEVLQPEFPNNYTYEIGSTPSFSNSIRCFLVTSPTIGVL